MSEIKKLIWCLWGFETVRKEPVFSGTSICTGQSILGQLCLVWGIGYHFCPT